MGVIGGSGVSAGLGTRDDGCGVTWLVAASKTSSAAAADARAISSYTPCERVSPSPFDRRRSAQHQVEKIVGLLPG
eukprot:scaffold14568_cov88-Phaeocystis_antarctica.AAC.1